MGRRRNKILKTVSLISQLNC